MNAKYDHMLENTWSAYILYIWLDVFWRLIL